MRCQIGTAGKRIAFAATRGADNLGATPGAGHSSLAGANLAATAALPAKSNRLFHVQIGDNETRGARNLPDLSAGARRRNG